MRTKINDIELYYELHGEGEPVIFSHGWLDDCSIWDSQVEALARKHAVITYDHRGHGRSDSPKGSYAVQVLANDLSALMNRLGLERATLVGFSLGGMAALVFALEHPNRVAKLVLVGTTARMASLVHVIGVLRHVLPYKTVARIVLKFRFGKPSRQMSEDALARAMKTDKAAAYECLEEFTKNYDIRDRVVEIKIPTLIVVGEKDKINLRASEYLHKKIDGSELRVIPTCGHTVMVEKPETFNQILEEFVG